MSGSDDEGGGRDGGLSAVDYNLTDDFFIGADLSESILEVGLGINESYVNDQKSKDNSQNNLSVREFSQRYSINERYIESGVTEGLDFHIKKSL